MTTARVAMLLLPVTPERTPPLVQPGDSAVTFQGLGLIQRAGVLMAQEDAPQRVPSVLGNAPETFSPSLTSVASWDGTDSVDRGEHAVLSLYRPVPCTDPSQKG